jgi:HSP20 family protein
MKKESFFKRLTGSIRGTEEETEIEEKVPAKNEGWVAEDEEGELTVDVYQTPSHIIVETMVAGVKPEDMSINISRDMITIKGKRQETKTISEDNYFAKELYWGAFSRTISLPQEVEPEDAEAIEKHGLLTIKLPKIDKNKKANLKVKSM